MKNPYFGRLLTAMVTPFNADGSVNLADCPRQQRFGCGRFYRRSGDHDC